MITTPAARIAAPYIKFCFFGSAITYRLRLFNALGFRKGKYSYCMLENFTLFLPINQSKSIPEPPRL